MQAGLKKHISTGVVGLAAALALVVAPAVQPPQVCVVLLTTMLSVPACLPPLANAAIQNFISQFQFCAAVSRCLWGACVRMHHADSVIVLLQFVPQAQAMLTAGDPVKNARAILRNALPVDNKPIRKVAQELESITESLRIPGKGAYNPVARAVNSASKTFTGQQKDIVKAFADDKKAAGTAAIASLTTAFKDLEQASAAKGDKGDILEYQQECLRYVGQIQEAMVKKFPFEVCFNSHSSTHFRPAPAVQRS